MSILGAQRIGEGSAEALLEAIEALQGRVARRLGALASRLTTDAQGRIVGSAANVATMEAIIAEAKATMFDDEFIAQLALYLQSFDAITGEVIDEFDQDLDEGSLLAVDRAFKAQLAEGITNPETYGSTWRGVANTMLLGIATNGVLSDTVGAVTQQVEEGGSILAAIEGDVATAPSTLQRTITQGVADQIGAEFFLYQGRPIKTTRLFCQEREGRVWHREEIAGWGRRAAAGEDLDGDGNPGWAGMVDGTNEQTIFQYLGGWYGGRYNCRHVLIPVALRDVPDADLARMRSAGLVD